MTRAQPNTEYFSQSYVSFSFSKSTMCLWYEICTQGVRLQKQTISFGSETENIRKKSNPKPTPHPTADKVSAVISEKTGINYPDLEPGIEFWNRVRVPGSCYKSLVHTVPWPHDPNKNVFGNRQNRLYNKSTFQREMVNCSIVLDRQLQNLSHLGAVGPHNDAICGARSSWTSPYWNDPYSQHSGRT